MEPIQIHEDFPLQKKAWKIQEICWVFIVLLMAAIALGLFGNGPLSRSHAIEENSLAGNAHRKGATPATGGDGAVSEDVSIEYDRFARNESQTETVVHLRNAGSAEVRIPVSFMNTFRIERIFPPPFESRIANGEIIYSFKTGNSHKLRIYFFLLPREPGRVSGYWTVNQKIFRLSQFIYP